MLTMLTAIWVVTIEDLWADRVDMHGGASALLIDLVLLFVGAGTTFWLLFMLVMRIWLYRES